MASAEGLECPVCCEPFDDQNICPRMLSCGHSFCTGCLERLLTADNKIPCPTCRDEVNVPQAGVVELPKNFALLSIINANITTQHEEGESSYACEACDDKHPATSFCLNCKEDMCKDAARFHTRNKASRHHKVISLGSSPVTVFCQEHKERFRLFDEVCGRLVCRGCIKLDHRGHNCSSLAEAASKCRQEMQELASRVNARTKVIKDGETQVVKARLYMEKAREEQAAEIHKLFKEVGSPLFHRHFHPNIAKKKRRVNGCSPTLEFQLKTLWSCKGTPRLYSI